MPTRPSTYIGWVPSGNPAYITQPTAGQSASGWVLEEAPPFEYMNWLFYILDQWVQYLDQFTQVVTITNASSPYAALASAPTIDCDTSGGAITINLPDPSTCKGTIFRVIHRTTDTNTITVANSTGISDSTSQTEADPWGVMSILSIGTRYILI